MVHPLLDSLVGGDVDLELPRLGHAPKERVRCRRDEVASAVTELADSEGRFALLSEAATVDEELFDLAERQAELLDESPDKGDRVRRVKLTGA